MRIQIPAGTRSQTDFQAYVNAVVRAHCADVFGTQIWPDLHTGIYSTIENNDNPSRRTGLSKVCMRFAPESQSRVCLRAAA